MNREIVRQSEAAYESLVNSYEEHVFMLDLKGTYVSSNDRVQQFCLNKGEDIKGRSIESVYPPPVASLYRKKMEQVKRSGKMVVFEHIMPAGKEQRYHMDTLFPVGMPDGSLRIGGICRDITIQRKTEQRLQRSQRLEALGTLAGGIAHDFNNILAPIMNYAYLCMKMSQPGSVLHEYLGNIMKSVERASDLVKQILSFSREGREDLKPVDIVPVVKETLKLMRAVMPATIELVQVTDTDDSRIMADPTDIHQIIMNLCTNASHAMTEGGRLSVSLKRFEADSSFVSAHPEFSPGSYLRLSVEDTGHGIPEDIIENIFEPYFTTKKKGQGTGLGLAIVHGIVRRMNGYINVYSEPGRGTVFHIYMPVAHAQEETDNFLQDEDNHRLSHGGERIMFIDDELHIVETAKMVLEGIGYSVSTFIDPVDALTKFREDPSAYDIVITDMTMPGMTGDGFALELLKLRPDLPVILCTGFSERMNIEKAGEMGIREYLMKPVNPRDLADAIRKALGRRKRTQ